MTIMCLVYCSQNVLLAKCTTSISGDFTCLLADFGLSRLLHHEGAAVALQKTVCGTPLFMSPELQQKKVTKDTKMIIR